MTPKERDDRAREDLCQQCGAPAGKKCIGSLGREIKTTHYVRRQAASEKERKRRHEHKSTLAANIAVADGKDIDKALVITSALTATEALKRLCARHARVGRCILCGRGPYVAVTLWGTCKHCQYSSETEAVRVLVSG